MSDESETTGIVHVAPGHGRRYRIGHESGDVFEEDDSYDGITLTIEATSAEDAKWILVETGAGSHFPTAHKEVLTERWRQWFWEGFTKEHDDQHLTGEIARAAACYALIGGTRDRSLWRGDIPNFWPWDAKWWKPTTRRRDLVKAAALLLAEIERLDRAASRSEVKS